MRLHNYIIASFISIILIFILFFIYAPHGQRFIGSFYDFLDSDRRIHIKQSFQNKSDKQLIKYLEHGDIVKQGQAAVILGERKPRDIFSKLIGIIETSSNEYARDYARRIIVSIDRDEACRYLAASLNKINKTSYDYRETISLLAYLKYQPVYPYLVEYAKREESYRTAAADYFAELNNPEAIPILLDMAKEVPETNDFTSRIDRERIENAIKTLKSIKNSQ